MLFQIRYFSSLAVGTALLAVLFTVPTFASEQKEQLSQPGLALSTGKQPTGKQSTGNSALSTEHRGESKQRARSHVSTSINSDFWVYDAFTELRHDVDGDGHYTRLIVDFDVDTVYLVADVYARLYLSRDQGPWNEYAVTEDFSVIASGSGDNYVMESDLVDGFPFGYYDVLIEIYDVIDNSLVAEFGPADSAALSDLPLEDEFRDGAGDVIVVSHGGGGSIDIGLLALLCALLLFTRRRYFNRRVAIFATYPQGR
ncbi:MAG: choice-of-anchor H family protein [Pseudomonadales bacterium]